MSPPRRLLIRLLYKDQPSDVSTVDYISLDYYIKTKRQMPPPKTNLYDRTTSCYWLIDQ